MLKAYSVSYKFSINGQTIHIKSDTQLLEENAIIKEENFLQGKDFNSLCTALENKNLHWIFNFSHIGKSFFKKEPRVYFFHDFGYIRYRSNEIQEWKVIKTIRDCNISMQELFDMRDSEKVIQYLKERGISACPILK